MEFLGIPASLDCYQILPVSQVILFLLSNNSVLQTAQMNPTIGCFILFIIIIFKPVSLVLVLINSIGIFISRMCGGFSYSCNEQTEHLGVLK